MLSTRRINTYRCVHCGSEIGTLWEQGAHYEIKMRAERDEATGMYKCPHCGKLTPFGSNRSKPEKSSEG